RPAALRLHGPTGCVGRVSAAPPGKKTAQYKNFFRYVVWLSSVSVSYKHHRPHQTKYKIWFGVLWGVGFFFYYTLFKMVFYLKRCLKSFNMGIMGVLSRVFLGLKVSFWGVKIN
ncbi:hypothetical protein ACVGWW_06225, partial [Enterobacter hormaechei]